MDKLILSDAAPSTSFQETRIICRVCQKQFSQYTCPRCNTRYCSLQCYKNHSLRCTESFMRENVMEELHQVQPEEETKTKMLDILKRFHSEEEDDMDYDEEDGSVLSEETIQKVLSGDEVRFEDISPKEIKQLQRVIVSGELGKLIEPWDPWWKKPLARAISLSSKGSRFVTPLQQEETITSEIPAGPDDPLPPLSQLSRTEPSPLLAVHLVDVLYSYCFASRFYNGDLESDPMGAAMVALSMSAVLGDDGRPETVAEALSSCLEQTCSTTYRHAGGFMFGIGLIDDITCLLSLGNDALVCLLCDLRRVLQAGLRMLKNEKMGKTKRGGRDHKLSGAEKKVYFLMCWVHEQPKEVWSSLAGIVEMEKASLLAIRGSREPKLARDEGTSRAKVVIEEI